MNTFKARRVLLGLSIKEFSKISGLSEPTVDGVEKDGFVNVRSQKRYLESIEKIESERKQAGQPVYVIKEDTNDTSN
jgi:transcriptional regulator with XRE-family HTH domain